MKLGNLSGLPCGRSVPGLRVDHSRPGGHADAAGIRDRPDGPGRWGGADAERLGPRRARPVRTATAHHRAVPGTGPAAARAEQHHAEPAARFDVHRAAAWQSRADHRPGPGRGLDPVLRLGNRDHGRLRRVPARRAGRVVADVLAPHPGAAVGGAALRRSGQPRRHHGDRLHRSGPAARHPFAHRPGRPAGPPSHRWRPYPERPGPRSRSWSWGTPPRPGSAMPR
jgi:hypothetical protein